MVCPSAEMVQDIGAKWVLIGHSERRRVFLETDEVGIFSNFIRKSIRTVCLFMCKEKLKSLKFRKKTTRCKTIM